MKYVGVCEAFLQSCLENFLCDECRKPAETCLEKETAIDEGVEDTPLHSSFGQQLQITKFQNAKNRTIRVKWFFTEIKTEKSTARSYNSSRYQYGFKKTSFFNNKRFFLEPLSLKNLMSNMYHYMRLTKT